MTEIWKSIIGFGDHYEASSLGRIRVKPRVIQKANRHGGISVQKYGERILAGTPDREGYLHVHLGVDGGRFRCRVHRLVATAFHGAPATGQECCHNNGDNQDNRPDNLRWDTHLANNRDRHAHGNYATGQDHHQSKFSPDLIDAVRSGAINKTDALAAGISHTHFYRLRKHGIDLLAEAERIANG